jgi:hypothetical protein
MLLMILDVIIHKKHGRGVGAGGLSDLISATEKRCEINAPRLFHMFLNYAPL